MGLGLRDNVGCGGEAELVDGHPGLRVGVQGVGGDGARVSQGVEIVDQCEAAVLVAEFGDVEDVLRFVEVVSVVAVGEDLGVGVA